MTENYIIKPRKCIVDTTTKGITFTPKYYPMNDLASVFTHYDAKLGKNIPTENKIKGDN